MTLPPKAFYAAYAMLAMGESSHLLAGIVQMGPVQIYHSLVHRVSQFGIHEWLLTFSCAIIAYYALQIARR